MMDKIVGQANEMGMTSLIAATLCNYKEAMMVVKHKSFIQKELRMNMEGFVTPVFNAAYFCRLETA